MSSSQLSNQAAGWADSAVGNITPSMTGGNMRTRIRAIGSGTPTKTMARILGTLRLVSLSAPVFYLGLLGLYALFLLDDAVSPNLVMTVMVPVLLMMSSLGTLASFRLVSITVVALATFYLGWVFTVYPFPDLFPRSLLYRVQTTMRVILCANLLWIGCSLGRLHSSRG